jgi:hypothetical protein
LGVMEPSMGASKPAEAPAPTPAQSVVE